MVQGTAPTFVKQVVPTDAYCAKLIADDIAEFDEYDFATGVPTGEKVMKYWADVAFDGVADEYKPSRVYTKRLFFKLATGERANLPKFLRAIGVPLDEKTGDFNTEAAVGRAWVVLDVVEKVGKNGRMNAIASYAKDKSHKASDEPQLPERLVDDQGWGVEPEPDAVPF